MNVEPVGLPAALKAWHSREPDPVLRMRCGVCGTDIGAVYHTPRGAVVESRISVPVETSHETFVPADIADLAAGLGLTGVLDGFGVPGSAETKLETSVRIQIDLLNSELYWHDPVPLCPEHGDLRIDRDALADAVRAGAEAYEAEE
ncbi:MAG TPA: hypothetical protein VM324_03295, partial [Egibacteraceae bacterium]|nr:hypothetical protein [Egibacteraceae bacterium]